MTTFRRRDGFLGEKQINISQSILDKFARSQHFLQNLYITHIGFFPKASFHYRERRNGCEDNILFYCLGGKGYYDTHIGSFELTANQFAILPPHHFHRYQADITDPWTIYWVHFSGHLLEEMNLFIDVAKYIKPNNIKYKEEIITIWEEMYNALQADYNISNIGYANFCLYRFISFFTFPEFTKPSLPRQDIIAEAVHFLKQNIDKNLSVENIAEKFNYSASHFSTLFKKGTGMSPMDYFIQMKIHYACQLLDQSSLKVKEITTKVGYDDPYYFSRLFTRIMGISPNKYKQKK